MNHIHQPIVSVVVPIYNVERYIRRCITSVLEQTFQNFEIVCVNDGSSDSSISIVESFGDSRIRVVNQVNKGLAAARNTGINHSRGFYIALLDADDFWKSNKLSKHVKHLQARPQVDVSYSASQFVDEDDNFLSIGQYPKISNITAEHIFCRNPVGNGSAAVMRRSFLMRIGRRVSGSHGETHFEYFDEELRQSEDIEFWLRSALDVAAVFEGVGEALTCYRINASGLSANLDKQFKSWHTGIDKNKTKHPEFFKRWYGLAAAYQQRYLARRAVQSGSGVVALKWLNRALFSDWRIILEEPARTAVTYGAAIFSLLPQQIYSPIEKCVMNLIGNRA